MKTNAQRVFLISNTGLYRSDDGGTSWKQMAADDDRIRNGQGGYNCGVYVDPGNPDVVITVSTSSYISRDGGKTFTGFKGAPGGDDPQQIWIDPTNGQRMLMGLDQGAAVTLDGRYDATLAGSRSLFVSWDADASGNAGSRAALYMLMQQAIREARSSGPPGEGALLHAAGREALIPYLAGGRTVFYVDRAADIRQLIAFAARNAMKPVIVGGAEAWVVADELARAAVPVILNPLDNLPWSFDQIGARLDNAVRLQRAGVRIAFSSGDIHNARKIRQLAGNAVAHGLPWDEALAAVTATPAEIFGLGAKRGRIAAGQAADLVLWDGDPLEVTSIADQVWIAGREVEMHSRQTQLRDRYFQRSSTDVSR
jgi:hypothetical protein